MATQLADISTSVSPSSPDCIICTENLWKTYQMGAEQVQRLLVRCYQQKLDYGGAPTHDRMRPPRLRPSCARIPIALRQAR